jgi:smad nuclear-interacting protein 1
VLKYNEPVDSRQPPASQDWRLFVFKGPDVLDTIPLATRSCWLIGREDAVVDLYVEHPSASKQHAVIQFRYVTKVSEFGDKKGKVKPYVIDLESSNGTVLNGDKIGGRRFIEVRSGDVMKIGTSDREYVFMLPPKE